MCSRSLRDRRRRVLPDLDVGDALGDFGHRPRSWARSTIIFGASGELCDIELYDGGASVHEGTAADQPVMLAGSGISKSWGGVRARRGVS